MSTALDGNAIAGTLVEVFGVEMTAAIGTCGRCGSQGPVAELEVFLRGPGIVGRCRRCSNVLLVLVTIREITCVDLLGLRALEPSPATSGAA